MAGKSEALGCAAVNLAERIDQMQKSKGVQGAWFRL